MTLRLYLASDAEAAVGTDCMSEGSLELAHSSPICVSADTIAATTREKLSYLTEMMEELREMAARSGFRRLNLILGMAHHQAIEEREALDQSRPSSGS